MKAKLILAAAATGHPDGTISMLRAGITHVWGDKPPIPLQATLVVRIESELSDMGNHDFDIKCMDEDGQQALPPVKGQFAVPQGGGVNNLILGLAVAFQKHGRYVFFVRVDNVELDFRVDGLKDIAEKAMKRKNGARGLRSILESVLLETMYNIPSTENVTKVVIDETVIRDESEPLLVYESVENKAAQEE